MTQAPFFEQILQVLYVVLYSVHFTMQLGMQQTGACKEIYAKRAIIVHPDILSYCASACYTCPLAVCLLTPTKYGDQEAAPPAVGSHVLPLPTIEGICVEENTIFFLKKSCNCESHGHMSEDQLIDGRALYNMSGISLSSMHLFDGGYPDTQIAI